MTAHSSTLAKKIRWTEEPGAGYCPWGRKESDMTVTSLTLTLCLQISGMNHNNDIKDGKEEVELFFIIRDINL